MKKILTLAATSILSFNAMAGMVVIGNNAGIDSLSQKDVKKVFMLCVLESVTLVLMVNICSLRDS